MLLIVLSKSVLAHNSYLISIIFIVKQLVLWVGGFSLSFQWIYLNSVPWCRDLIFSNRKTRFSIELFLYVGWGIAFSAGGLHTIPPGSVRRFLSATEHLATQRTRCFDPTTFDKFGTFWGKYSTNKLYTNVRGDVLNPRSSGSMGSFRKNPARLQLRLRYLRLKLDRGTGTALRQGVFHKNGIKNIVGSLKTQRAFKINLNTLFWAWEHAGTTKIAIKSDFGCRVGDDFTPAGCWTSVCSHSSRLPGEFSWCKWRTWVLRGTRSLLT